MKAVCSRLGMALLLVAATSSLAFAQGSTVKAVLSGTVIDKDGGVIPGASVVVKSVNTGVSQTTQTNGSGAFSVPALDPGGYDVTVSLQNFKTVKIDKVTLAAGSTQNLKVTLELGAMTDEVKVTAHADLVETSNTNVAATISMDQINNLPLVTKNALNFVTFLPGVNSGNGSHSQRSSTIMGLPQSTISITIDGVNVQDQYIKSGDGFFAVVRPQTDLVEEVTVSEATPGADSSGQGAVQIKFVTRSGSNQPNGSAYEYFRHPSMNTNAFYNTINGGTIATTCTAGTGAVCNLAKNNIIVNQYGFREGGPIVLPGLYDGHGKAFYFFNYEEMRQPSTITRTRTVLSSLAQAGTFQYGCTAAGCNTAVNLFTVGNAFAANVANGTTAVNGFANAAAASAAIARGNVVDPTNAAIQAFINNAITTTGSVKPNTDLNSAAFTWQPASLRVEHIPGGRLDYNLSNKERLTATYEFQKVNSNPDILNSRDPIFPGHPNHGAQYSFRNSGSVTVRSTLTSNIVNEAGGGFIWDPVYFSGDIVPAEFALGGGCASALTCFNVNQAFSTSPFNGANIQARNGSNYNMHDTVSWLKGKHSLSFGVSYTKVMVWNQGFNVVPSLGSSLDTNQDPAAGMFSTAFFPGATSTDLGNARALYAQLTGRITSVAQGLALQADGTYKYGGAPREDIFQKEAGGFIQDQWHIRPNVTINAGLRYEVQYPVTPSTSVYSTNDLNMLCGQSGFGAANAAAARYNAEGLPCNFGNPGVLNASSASFVSPTNPKGQLPECVGNNTTTFTCYTQYQANTPGYSTDTNNFAPSIGLAWQPNVQHGFLRAILGDPALATVRASYGRSFNQGGLSDYSGVFENGPGLTFPGTRNNANLNFFCGPTANVVQNGVPCDGTNSAYPILLTPGLTSGAFGPPQTCTGPVVNGCIPLTPSFPQNIIFATANSVFLLDPKFQTSYTDSFSVGLARALSKDMSIEVRFVRTQNKHGLSQQELNEQNIFTNPFGSSANFLDEFKKAQGNLVANVAAGNGATFAFKGLPGQNPLPIMLASYSGAAACGAAPGSYSTGNAGGFCAGASNPANYTSTQFTQTTNVQALSLLAPSVGTFALFGTSTSTDLFFNPTFRANGIAAGMPINFFVMNPDSGLSTVQTSNAITKYNSVQVLLTRRLSQGLSVSANYAYQIQYQSSGFESYYRTQFLDRSTTSVPNAAKLTVNYDVPIGRGKRFGTNMPGWANAAAGGWQLNLTGRIENGRLINIGDVQLVGMTLDDLQHAFRYYRNPADGRWYDLPQDIIANTAKAFAVDATQPNGHPACTGSNPTTCGGPAPGSRFMAPASTTFDPTTGLPIRDAAGNVTGCVDLFRGDCSAQTGRPRNSFITAPIFTRFDLSAKKSFPFARHSSIQVEMDILNVFNAIDFNSVFTTSSTVANYQVNSAYSDISNTFDPGGRLGQLVIRVNW